MKCLLLYLFSLLVLQLAPAAAVALELVPSETHEMEVLRREDGILSLTSTGVDPQLVFSVPVDNKIDEKIHMLAFEYFCPDGIDLVEVFYTKANQSDWSQKRQIPAGKLPKAETWQPFAVDLQQGSRGNWGPNDRRIRIDFGQKPGRQLQIRKLQLRAATKAERQDSSTKDAQLEAKRRSAAKLNHYLQLEPLPAEVEQVAVTSEHIRITGNTPGRAKETYYLKEYRPHEDPWTMQGGEVLSQHRLNHQFTVEIPRYLGETDRIAHRFGVVAASNGQAQLISRAVWASDVSEAAERDMPRLRPANKKGLGDVSLKQGIFKRDLRDLGIRAATVNFALGSILNPGADPILYQHQGHSYRYNRAAIQSYDERIRWLTEHDIVVSAILLIDKAAGILVHPEFNPAGTYAMANMTSEAATDAYRALIAFLAERYSRPNRAHGWITHWIVFNEVDYGWTWTNMGEQPMALYMNTYNKAMRLTWLEARRFNPTAEVFISLTHNWQYNPADPLRIYSPRSLLDRMALYSHKVGDYHWGVAYHPYPQSLLKPRTWEDQEAPHSFEAPYITPKNIEVLDAYLQQPNLLYQGAPRTVLLSEQGYHTPDYEKDSLQDQAAALAYTWEKILPLDTVESFHYHRWVDHPLEGGLRVGLRTLPEEGGPHGLRKEPVFSLFSALETEKHREAIDAYKDRIGIKDWDDIRVNRDAIKE